MDLSEIVKQARLALGADDAARLMDILAIGTAHLVKHRKRLSKVKGRMEYEAFFFEEMVPLFGDSSGIAKGWHVRPFRNIYEEQIRVSVMTDHVLEWSTIHYGRETINNQNQITEQ